VAVVPVLKVTVWALPAADAIGTKAHERTAITATTERILFGHMFFISQSPLVKDLGPPIYFIGISDKV
jgi:hypothetical protein